MVAYQAEMLVRRTLPNVSDKSIKTLIDGFRENLLAWVRVYGVLPNSRLEGKVMIEYGVDWGAHHALLNSEGPEIEVPPHWKNGVSVEIDVASRLFNEVVKDNNLDRKLRYKFVPGCNTPANNERLGLTDAESISMPAGRESRTNRLENLLEGHITVDLAQDFY